MRMRSACTDAAAEIALGDAAQRVVEWLKEDAGREMIGSEDHLFRFGFHHYHHSSDQW
jgi:hypothetical protein